MKNYIKELIILIIQLFMFYIFPMFAGPTDAMGMVFIIIITSFILSFLITVISNNKIRYLYGIVISILFLPSVFIYYNESALVHSIWYLVVSYIGIFIGFTINLIIKRIQ